jgi:hypothetical protein
MRRWDWEARKPSVFFLLGLAVLVVLFFIFGGVK